MLGHGADKGRRRASEGHTENGVRASEADAKERGQVRQRALRLGDLAGRGTGVSRSGVGARGAGVSAFVLFVAMHDNVPSSSGSECPEHVW